MGTTSDLDILGIQNLKKEKCLPTIKEKHVVTVVRVIGPLQLWHEIVVKQLT